jgi:hypothetical protein
VRYAEPKDGTSGAALDFARVDGATASEANAVVVGRADGNVRYLTAPWVRTTSVRDLLKPHAATTALGRSPDGVTDPLASPAARAGECRSWTVLQVRDDTATRLMTDLGELAPAHLTAGRPGTPREASAPAGLTAWSRTGCSLGAVRSQGVRSVNAWAYARQQLPEQGGDAIWLCTRADTWGGDGSRVLAQIQAPGKPTAAVAAQAEDSPACGVRDPRVLAGVLWKADTGHWYLVAAGSKDVTEVTATGGVHGTAQGNALSLRTAQGTKSTVTGRLPDGTTLAPLH